MGWGLGAGGWGRGDQADRSSEAGLGWDCKGSATLRHATPRQRPGRAQTGLTADSNSQHTREMSSGALAQRDRTRNRGVGGGEGRRAANTQKMSSSKLLYVDIFLIQRKFNFLCSEKKVPLPTATNDDYG